MPFPTIFGKQRASPRNILAGIIPTVDTFSVNPTSLEQITNGDMDTPTGYGTKTVGGAGYIGMFYFDQGVRRNILVAVKAGVYSSANSMQIFIDPSADGVTYRSTGSNVLSVAATSENVKDSSPQLITDRYFRLRCYCTGAADGAIRLYQVLGHEIKY